VTRRVTVALLAGLGACHLALAQGGPPMITDDPGTPGDGRWEVNVAATGHRDANSSLGELPLLDINYGLGETIQLKYEVPWVVLHEEGSDSRSGLGNSLLGVKWRFYDAGNTGWQISTYPQLEFRNPGSDSASRGLAEDATTVLLPFEFLRTFASIAVNFEVGREFPSQGEDAWLGGAVFSHVWREGLEGMAELHAEASESLDRSSVSVNLGARVAAGERGTLLLSVGRDLHNNLEEKVSIFGYVGWQLMF
jgi:hypothetical protein